MYAFASVKLFISPGSSVSMIGPAFPVVVKITPPVWLRLIICGLDTVHAGQLLAGFAALGCAERAPFATLLEMDGFPVRMKLP